MRKRALWSTLPPDAHTWENAIPVSTRAGIVQVLSDIYQRRPITCVVVRSQLEMTGHEHEAPRVHTIRSVDDIAAEMEKDAAYLDRFDHFQVLIHESERVPDQDHVDANTVHPQLITVVAQHMGEYLPLAG